MIAATQCLPVVLGALLRDQPLTRAKVDFAWRTAAGAALGRAAAVELRDGVLHARVANRQWKREIDRAADVLLARMALLLGRGVVERLAVESEQQERPPRRRAGR